MNTSKLQGKSGWRKSFTLIFKMADKNEDEKKDPIIEKTEAVEAQVEEVKVVMDQNLQSMMERGEQLEDLEHKTVAITTGAEAFNKNTKAVTKKLWWKNIQATITFAFVVLLIIVGIIVYFIYSNKSKSAATSK